MKEIFDGITSSFDDYHYRIELLNRPGRNYLFFIQLFSVQFLTKVVRELHQDEDSFAVRSISYALQSINRISKIVSIIIRSTYYIHKEMIQSLVLNSRTDKIKSISIVNLHFFRYYLPLMPLHHQKQRISQYMYWMSRRRRSTECKKNVFQKSIYIIFMIL